MIEKENQIVEIRVKVESLGSGGQPVHSVQTYQDRKGFLLECRPPRLSAVEPAE